MARLAVSGGGGAGEELTVELHHGGLAGVFEVVVAARPRFDLFR